MSELSHTIVFVRDMARSVAFYRDLLGLPVRFESAKWTEFETPGTTLALHLADVASDGMTISASADADAIPAGVCHLSFAVDDLDAFHEKMTANGVHCLQPPKEEDFGGRLAGYADPDGLPFWVGGKADKS
jgi:lactoylglutathione lyase